MSKHICDSEDVIDAKINALLVVRATSSEYMLRNYIV
jgi:hypothetical protein